MYKKLGLLTLLAYPLGAIEHNVSLPSTIKQLALLTHQINDYFPKFVAACSDNNIYIHDSTGKISTIELEFPSSFFKVSPDGKSLASLYFSPNNYDNYLARFHLINLETLQVEQHLINMPPVSDMVWRDNTTVYFTNKDQNTTCVYSIKDKTKKFIDEKYLAWSKDFSKYVRDASPNGILVNKKQPDTFCNILTGEGLKNLAFNHNAQLLLNTYKQGGLPYKNENDVANYPAINVWDTETAQPIASIGNKNEINQAQFFPNEDIVGFIDNKTIKAWDLDESKWVINKTLVKNEQLTRMDINETHLALAANSSGYGKSSLDQTSKVILINYTKENSDQEEPEYLLPNKFPIKFSFPW